VGEFWAAAPRGVELGYAQRLTTFTTTSDTAVDVTSLSLTVTVGARPIYLEFYGPACTNNANNCSVLIWLMEGSTQLQFSSVTPYVASVTIPFHVGVRLNPSAGSHTYKVQTARLFGGTVSLIAAAGEPVYFRAIEQ
jgi:hypothetical protein